MSDRTQVVKPGTRCECRDQECTGNCGHGQAISGRNQPARQCHRDAVRLVTVASYVTMGQFFGLASFYPSDKQIPMCASCADWHEAKGA